MLVFGDHRDPVSREDALARVRSALHDRDAVRLLIEWGVLEAAVADAHCPEADDLDPLLLELRAMSRLAGHALIAEPERWLHAFARGFDRLDPRRLPPVLKASVPEGYAWYGTHPEAHAAAARRFAAATGAERVVCIGLRSIGTSLSAAAQAALEADGVKVTSWTLRPRGHPFDRRPQLGPRLTRWLAALRDAWFLVIDEGPGLSGTSLVGTALALEELGVPRERIALLPAADPDPERFVSDTARRHWGSFRRFVVPAEDLVGTTVLTGLADHYDDLTGGRWRGLLHAGAPAMPLYERRKLLLARPRADQPGVLAKFVGLGRWGEATRDRAERLAAMGVGPPVLGLVDGYLLTAFARGRPATPADVGDLVPVAASYIAQRAAWTTDRPVPFDALLAMIRANVAEGLGSAWLPAVDRLESARSAVTDAPTVEVDGRLLLHEWLRTADGWLKTDGADHCADHWLPGVQDVAWDVAGLLIEADLPDADAVLAAFGPEARAIRARLPFHVAAYAAFRLGVATLATTVGGPGEAAPWIPLRARYARHLREALS